MAERRATVLLVEDEPSIRVVSQRMLELAGYRVVTCATGREAIELVARGDGPIDVLLSDVELGGLDGPAVAEAVRRVRPGIGVVLMSGYAAEEVTGRGLVGGARFLAKPYTRHDLVAVIEAALEDSERASGRR